MSDSERLCFLPAVDLLSLFKERKLSPVDVLKAQIAKIEKENDKINAVTMKHYEEAMVQARESEKRYKEGNPRPLEGITCAVKDEAKVKGWRVTMGSLILKDVEVEPEDGTMATRLRELGVVMHVQTNVPEFYCNAVTWSHLWGVCRNPWNLEFTAGGSSGGSGAALAAGFTTLATGSDMGGSIRIPSAMCGLYGFKPPYGRVATSLCQYESDGPMARTFADMNAFQNGLSGPSPFVLSSIRPKLEYPSHYGDVKGWKIAIDFNESWGLPIDKSTIEAMKKAADHLRAAGATVEEVKLGFTIEDLDTFILGLFSTSMGPACFDAAAAHLDQVTPYIANLVKKHTGRIAPEHLLKAETLMTAHHRKVQEKIFGKGFKAILQPTMVTPYVPADLGQTPEKNKIKINGEEVALDRWEYFCTWMWNLLGHYPSLNVPIGQTHDKVPIGMQVIGNTYDDLTAFQVASNLPQAIKY